MDVSEILRAYQTEVTPLVASRSESKTDGPATWILRFCCTGVKLNKGASPHRSLGLWQQGDDGFRQLDDDTTRGCDPSLHDNY